MYKSSLISSSKIFLVAASLMAALVTSGCGNDSKADLSNGKQLFVEKCGACHKLARAENAQGITGPDLDNAFKQSRADGITDSTIQGVVLGQIKIPSQRLEKSLKMPANIVEGNDARDVAAYVGYAAGRAGKDEGALADAGKPASGD